MQKDFSLRKIPLLPFLTAFAIGIWLEYCFNYTLRLLLLLYIVSVVICFVYSLLSSHIRFAARYVYATVLLLAFVVAGALVLYKNNPENNRHFAGNFTDVPAYLIRLNEPLTQKPKTYKSAGSIERILVNGKWLHTKSDAFIYFRKDSTANELGIGSQIVVTKKLQGIANNGNPGEFDYAAYCHRNGIYFQSFLNKNEYAVLPENNATFWETSLNNTRQWIIRQIDKNVPDAEARSVAKALLIGYRGDLDKDVLQAFANAGVIHIIAISGMHLILIGGIFIWLLSPLKRLKHGRFMHTCIVLMIVWAFTFIAGAVPSITRAAVMFTVLLSANLINRKYTIYNALAFSAFLLLVINPYNLWDAGFVLSYAAVLSIVLFYTIIYKRIYFQNKILQGLWNLVAMSLSAQIITLPFVLFFFHRFPVLFLLANIVAVPLSGIILYIEMLMIMLAFVPPVSLFTGRIVQVLILLFDAVTKFIGNVSFATIDFADITIVQMALLFIAMTGLYFLMAARYRNGFTLFVACLAGCIIIGLAKYIRQDGQQKIVVYNVARHYVLDVVQRHHLQSFSDTLFDNVSDEYNYTLKPARQHFNVVSDTSQLAAHAHFPVIEYGNKRLFVLDKNSATLTDAAGNIDVVIVSKNRYIDFVKMKQRFPTAVFVFTNENSLWKIEKWKSACDSLHLHSHSIPRQGAFVMNL